MASKLVMLSVGLVVLLLALAAASANTGCDSSERRHGGRWRQQLRACDEYMQRGREGGRGRMEFEPSQQCCQNLQRISSQDRCRALREVYGQQYSDDQASMERASRLLQQCDLRPRDCGHRSGEGIHCAFA